ncbi:MAG: hypothetical protein ABJB70_07605, partial [Candidatus Udaeobacter sp.]
ERVGCAYECRNHFTCLSSFQRRTSASSSKNVVSFSAVRDRPEINVTTTWRIARSTSKNAISFSCAFHKWNSSLACQATALKDGHLSLVTSGHFLLI